MGGVALVVAWIVGTVAVAHAAYLKNLRARDFVWISLLASPLIGAIIVAGMPAGPSGKQVRCPFCKSLNIAGATVCRYCTRESGPSVAPTPPPSSPAA